ncbi:hypothetical protein [Nocardia pneumoniae]|uniref:hypothetical protein n=1 Tax=Nocardia pneumoniae TaxID=228601 RepID=UPI00030A4E1D|nr:hypothetical protein [Nocardia pneumoniae]
MAVIRMVGWRRWIAPAGTTVSLIVAAATASAEPIVPVSPPSACAEAGSGAADAACGDAPKGRGGPAMSQTPLPLQMLAPPPARSTPSTNTPAGALVPPAPGQGGATPIVPAR